MESVFTTKDGAIVWHGVASDPVCFAFARKSSNIFPLELQIGTETKTSRNGEETIDMFQETEDGEEEANCEQEGCALRAEGEQSSAHGSGAELRNGTGADLGVSDPQNSPSLPGLVLERKESLGASQSRPNGTECISEFR
ncbi:hypothetical protein GUITHDRAFT_160416 [Guillardia theta CCMP2712]|uniref:Uncharacterized protein n=1 Tax=Guillardia theta (strain CCMP2712) TaxID=905079 RepID=L1K3V5_GUITC|nr:hypothetical protein GUITHDRAFT_160416 [Guillardia theta CCMP2712]EKX55264.1 hypothetical protein GUITHDRAFT_160416 [Guillardia theta CCMP2712]|eukprot:XP_005842244.1 hypothetical protein GUITHDRAFT_160416 [Guillardia theta CCMP2712]